MKTLCAAAVSLLITAVDCNAGDPLIGVFSTRETSIITSYSDEDLNLFQHIQFEITDERGATTGYVLDLEKFRNKKDIAYGIFYETQCFYEDTSSTYECKIPEKDGTYSKGYGRILSKDVAATTVCWYTSLKDFMNKTCETPLTSLRSPLDINKLKKVLGTHRIDVAPTPGVIKDALTSPEYELLKAKLSALDK